MSASRRLTTGLAIHVAFGVVASSGAQVVPVAEEMAEICRSFRESREPYHGRIPLRELEARLASSSDLEPARARRLRLRFAEELIEAGEPERAASVLEAARRGSSDERSDAELLLLLTTAHLQAGEARNCVVDPAAGRCILPLTEDARHARPEHARNAGDAALELATRFPQVPIGRWLLNVSRMLSDDYPDGVPETLRLPTSALESDHELPMWRDRGTELGLDDVDMAGGAILDDFDGDGLLDIITSTADPCDHLKAYRNDGDGGFEDVSRSWGLDVQLGGLNITHADYDGDGALDLLVLRGGWLGGFGRVRNSLLRNELGTQVGTFVDRTYEAGMAEPAHPTQTAAWADYDGDGDLDVYVGNEAPGSESGISQLFRNEGPDADGIVRFHDVASELGVRNEVFAKGVTWGDYDNDGDPDLYVSNVGPNRLYRNDGRSPGGDFVFRDVAAVLGVERPALRSFATWFFDYDNDGWLDLFVADYRQPPDVVMASYLGTPSDRGQPLVYRNEGGTFREVSRSLGIVRPSLPMGANYGDLDNDGWLDFYLGTGEPSFWAVVPNTMHRNLGGEEFVDVTFAGGFGHLQKGHGVAFGDVDNDGDQDLLHQLGGFYTGDAFGNALFENPGSDASWVTLRLTGTRANRHGVGARIAVAVTGDGGRRTIHRVAGSGGSFGGSSLQQEIGLGDAAVIDRITILWPGSGTRQELYGIQPNRVFAVIEGETAATEVQAPAIRLK